MFPSVLTGRSRALALAGLILAAPLPSVAFAAPKAAPKAAAKEAVKAAPKEAVKARAAVKATEVRIALGRSAMISADQPISSIINPNPKLIVTDLPSRRQLVVFGQAEGVGELRLLNSAGEEFQRLELTVEQDLSSVESLIAEAIGAKGVRVRHVGTSIVLSGAVANAGQYALAADIAAKSGAGGQVVNLLNVSGSDQVTFAVRVLELRTSKLKSLGLKWAAMQKTSAGTTSLGNVFDSGVLTRPGDQFSLAASSTFKVGRSVIDAFVDFLRTEGEAKLLAEPTIVATAGKGAKFLSGGEIPIPVPYAFGGGVPVSGGGTATNTFQGIIYKQYGISLNASATIDSRGRIELHISPEVSSVDYANAIEYGGNRVPALATRRAETDLRLNSGETIIFAGLTSRVTSRNTTRLPVGGSRFLDFLAGPQSQSNDESELIIIVTPTLGGTVEAGRPAMAASADGAHAVSR